MSDAHILPFHPALMKRNAKGELYGNILRVVNGDVWIDNEHWLNGVAIIRKPIPEATTQPEIHPYGDILHSNAGPGKTPWWNLWAYWNRSDITGEAHFQVDMDGTMLQALPFNRRADCNYKANSFFVGTTRVGFISFETQDNGHPTLTTTPWTFLQLNQMIHAMVAQCICYGSYCSSPTAWNDSGIGYHSQYKEWSSYVGKTCPGAARIRQMDYVRSEVARILAEFSSHTGWKCGTGLPKAA